MSVLSKSQLYEFRNSTRYFSKAVTESLNEFSSESKTGKTTIFLSHKHDERKELDSVISFLKKINVNVYVDWLDEGMPKTTSGKTATRIKLKIKENDKFIFLATEGAINSKWCNWELGFGDSHKFDRNIALFPVRDDGFSFSGNEYLQIYPRIEYVSRNSVSRRIGGYFDEGYYVISPRNEDGTSYYTKIEDWLKR
ncbi:toll/interleukin-1 receptor domain-containing protein [Sediminibacter sp. Hel_I_10]|uniref:toll/interleukin-1 receptor domain-containing protein n=1 Tax=Sediminibacter sp. Hel_I_10 TaxID=1392490 RepID=UPI0004799FA1|nr:toll/interleukin-1 receptor domain-containing protein [Sediminibacter sp. Hel_I_10]